MQVNSITGYNFGKSMKFSRAEEPAPAPQQPQPQPEQEPAKSIYFTGEKDNSGKAMRKATMAVLLPLSMLTANTALTSCEKEYGAYAYTEGYVNAEAETIDSCGCGHKHGHGQCPNDSTSHDSIPGDTTPTPEDTIPSKPEDDFVRSLPLDTLAKHMLIWSIYNFNDTTANGKRNIVHYHYARPWEYNNQVDAYMNFKESSLDKNILVHDTKVTDYKGNLLYYGKEVREVPKNDVTLVKYDGKTIKTNKLMTLEFRRCDGDVKGAPRENTSLDEKLALITNMKDKTVDVYRLNKKDGKYYQDGEFAKGYLDDNSILAQDIIGEYNTDEHITDWKLLGITDKELIEEIKNGKIYFMKW